jgi:signal transduction histidine kinase
MSVISPPSTERLPPGHRHALPDARRADAEELEREIGAVTQSPIVAALLQSVDTLMLVLNAQRQIVAFNGRRLEPGAALAGVRPGDALSCANARADGGCGTAPACETCGALGAILSCERKQRAIEAECLVSSAENGGSLEFNVRATPILVEGRTFTVVSMRDISAEKRRDALEQVFFHDVLNTVTGLRGWASALRRRDADHLRAGERIDQLSRQLEREIRDHRTLVMAERGVLVPSFLPVHLEGLLHDLELVFSSHAVAKGRRLRIAAPPSEATLQTDPSLLLRILVNMTRNALEATEEGGEVRVWLERRAREGLPVGDPEGEALRFSVWNAGVIPVDVQARIFQRSFSTKAERGRGLGTYGMKILGERYLCGTVSFVSAVEPGTVFSIELPAAPPSPAPERR